MTPAFLRYALSQGPHALADAIYNPEINISPRQIIDVLTPGLTSLVAKQRDRHRGAATLQSGLAEASRATSTANELKALRRITGGLSQLPKNLYLPDIHTDHAVFRNTGYYELFAQRWAARMEAEGSLHTKEQPAFWSTATVLNSEQSNILHQIEVAVETTDDPVVIFDLDECLFASKMREWQIWQEFAKSDAYPEVLRRDLKSLTPQHITSWDLKHVMVDNLGMDATLYESHRVAMRAFHAARFFTNNYLAYDTPLPGAGLFVSGLHARGAHIVYLTGRSHERMRAGTIGALLAGGFPIDPIDWRTTLLMKPDSANIHKLEGESEDARISRQRTSDEAFKRAVYDQIAALGTVVASFDNEPANIIGLFNRFHTGAGFAVRVNTMAAREQALVKGVFLLDGFVR